MKQRRTRRPKRPAEDLASVRVPKDLQPLPKLSNEDIERARAFDPSRPLYEAVRRGFRIARRRPY